jgi:hypothetical protein
MIAFRTKRAALQLGYEILGANERDCSTTASGISPDVTRSQSSPWNGCPDFRLFIIEHLPSKAHTVPATQRAFVTVLSEICELEYLVSRLLVSLESPGSGCLPQS